MDAILFGLVLAFIAGLSTTIGGLIVFLIKEPKKKYLVFSLAFSTGVMITVSFVEMLPNAIESIGYTNALTLFFAGSIITAGIDFLIPHTYIVEKISNKKAIDPKLLKTGLFVALGLAIHNFPEGFAVFAGSLHSMELGLILAIAITIHNIPEGVAVAIPIYFSTHDKKQAFITSFFSGLAEPIGAIIAAVLLLPFLSETIITASLAFIAGIMVYICIDELLPAAYVHCEAQQSHLMPFGFLAGSIVMGITLVLLA